jgi:hypothetical protein
VKITFLNDPGQLPDIPTEELFARFQDMLHVHSPILPPQHRVVEPKVASTDPLPILFIIPVWDVQNLPSLPELVIPQIYPFPAIAFPSGFLPCDGSFELVDLFGSSDTSDEEPYVWMATEHDAAGAIGLKVDALVEIQEEGDKSYRYCSSQKLAGKAVDQTNPNIEDRFDMQLHDQLKDSEEECLPDESEEADIEDQMPTPVNPHRRKRKSKRRQLHEARAKLPRHTAISIKDAKRFVWSVIVEGARYEQQRRVFNWNNIAMPSKWTFYKTVDSICDDLVTFAQASCLKWRGLMTDESSISFDGSWSQRRNAHHCFGALMDPIQRKVVDFETVPRSFGHQKIFLGDYEGPSKAMECEILRHLAPRWRDDQRVKWFVHDQDSCAMAVLREEGWNLTERFDLNHVIQSWKKMFKKQRKVPINKAGEKVKCRDVLRGLEIPLLKWFHTIVKLDNDLEAKRKKWLGAYEFYIFPPRGLPSGRFVWKNRNDEVCRK